MTDKGFDNKPSNEDFFTKQSRDGNFSSNLRSNKKFNSLYNSRKSKYDSVIKYIIF